MNIDISSLGSAETTPFVPDLNQRESDSSFDGASLPPSKEDHLSEFPSAQAHLRQYPFEGLARGVDYAQCRVWYEGTFNPFGENHFEVIDSAMKLGFGRATLAIVFQNPYKPETLPYRHRAEMARLVLENRGYRVVSDPKEAGICILDREEDFHLQRMISMFDSSTYILIGPDNFEKAIRNNILWVHPEGIVGNSSANKFFGFERMYNHIDGFRERVLVFPHHHPSHSTDIRNGDIPPPAEVADYIKQHHLYIPQVVAHSRGPSLRAEALGLNPEKLQLVLKLEPEVLTSLAEVGLEAPEGKEQVLKVRRSLAKLDPTELRILDSVLAKADYCSAEMGVGTVSNLSVIAGDVCARTLRDTFTEVAGGLEVNVTGIENLTQALADGTRIILLGNHQGWPGVSLMPAALTMHNLRGPANQLWFLLNREQFLGHCFYPHPLTEYLFKDSLNRIEFSAEGSGARELVRDAASSALAEFAHSQLLVFFPEGNEAGNEELRNFCPGILEGILDWNERVSSIFGDGSSSIERSQSKTVILPFSVDFRLSDQLLQGGSYSLRFGEALPLRLFELLGSEYNTKTLSHFLGYVVASLADEKLRANYSLTDKLAQNDREILKAQKLFIELKDEGII